EFRRVAGVLLIVLHTVIYGGVTILTLLINDPRYMENKLRQDLWRAGHAHAGVLLVLSLLVLRYADEANLTKGWKYLASHLVPLSAILLPAGFFLSVFSPDATEPNALIYVAYFGAVVLAFGLVCLCVGVVRKQRSRKDGVCD